MDEELLNKIISVAYGDANLIDKIKIHWLAKHKNEIKSTLEKYTLSFKQIKSIKEEKIPEQIIENVTNITHVKTNNSILFNVYRAVFSKPAIVPVTLGIIILTIASIFFFNNSQINNQYTQQEIELADRNIKHSLALVASVFNKTKNEIEKDILIQKVGKPVHKGINVVNDLFTGENKNEKNN